MRRNCGHVNCRVLATTTFCSQNNIITIVRWCQQQQQQQRRCCYVSCEAMKPVNNAPYRTRITDTWQQRRWSRPRFPHNELQLVVCTCVTNTKNIKKYTQTQQRHGYGVTRDSLMYSFFERPRDVWSATWCVHFVVLFMCIATGKVDMQHYMLNVQRIVAACVTPQSYGCGFDFLYRRVLSWIYTTIASSRAPQFVVRRQRHRGPHTKQSIALYLSLSLCLTCHVWN